MKVYWKRVWGSADVVDDVAEDAEGAGVAAEQLLARPAVAAVAGLIAGHFAVTGRALGGAERRSALPVAGGARFLSLDSDRLVMNPN